MKYIVELSHELFQGFTITVDSYDFDGMDFPQQSMSIRKIMQQRLVAVFEALSLFNLAIKAKTLDIHLHASLQHGIINYACDHCH